MIKNQAGFSVIESVLILVIVGMVGLVGWFVWQSENKTTKLYSHSSNSPIFYKTYTDPAKVYSFKYPANCKVTQAAVVGASVENTPLYEPLLLTCPGTSKATATDSQRIAIGFYGDNTPSTALQTQRSWSVKSQVPKHTMSKENDVYYLHNVYSGYEDEEYLLTHKGASLDVIFREKGTATTAGSKTGPFDVTYFSPIFKQIISSVSFLN